MPQTIVEKIAQAHMAEGPKRPLRAGDFVSIRPFHVMTHDNTSAVMSKFKAIGARKIFDARQLVFALDHDIQNQDEANVKKYRSIEAFAKEHKVDFYPAGSGIGHQIMIERGYRIRFALQYVRRAGRGGNAHRADRCRGGVGDGRILVADSTHHPRRIGR
jgi:homoaconitate hydratase